MNKYKVVLSLQVEVEAFDSADAMEAVVDVFGPGETAGVTVTDLKVKNVAEL